MFKKLKWVDALCMCMVMRNNGNFSAFGHVKQRFINTLNASTFPFANSVCAEV